MRFRWISARCTWVLPTFLLCSLAGCSQVLDPSSSTETSSASSPENRPSNTAASGQPTAPPPEKPPTTLPPTTNPANAAARGLPAGSNAGLPQGGAGVARVILEPARTLFAFQDSAVLKIQIPQAMQLFRASQNRVPQSHEEFMARIVSANNLRLPKLPPGQRYVYDPRRGELMVERSIE